MILRYHAVQLVEKWPVWLHFQTGRNVNEG
jgi:hypothetical protein